MNSKQTRQKVSARSPITRSFHWFHTESPSVSSRVPQRSYKKFGRTVPHRTSKLGCVPVGLDEHLIRPNFFLVDRLFSIGFHFDILATLSSNLLRENFTTNA